MAIIGPYHEQGYGADSESYLSNEMRELETKINRAIRETTYGQRVYVEVGAYRGKGRERQYDGYSGEAINLSAERCKEAGWLDGDWEVNEDGKLLLCLVPSISRELEREEKWRRLHKPPTMKAASGAT